ncbi:MAG: hypothetical protein H6Q17_2662 [Bacteroidetes bacterium]|nr:hypothetical protein [Bacteroidota bacterium]
MNTISDILSSFDPISLPELSEVQLLDRTDMKYIFHIGQLERILAQSQADYKILTIDGQQYGHYETRYLDTPDYSLYTNHHNGRCNRYKIRFRTYLDSGQSFFEIKFKSNKGRTVKERMRLHENQHAMTPESRKFLEEKTDLKADSLAETIQINYNRITLVNKLLTERLTIDFDMTYRIDREDHLFPNLVIAEVKQQRNGHSPFRDIMQDEHIQSLSISKYCLGIASFSPNVKTNSFKSKLLYVNKLSHYNAN